jgi:hypothetical protein
VDEAPGQTRDEVLQAAREADCQVSADQLARWHRAGLLPRPRQQALGRGRGTVTLYPAGTSAQVIALCRIKSQHRNLNRAAFQLWWEGFGVDEAQVRAPLLKAAAEVNGVLRSLSLGPEKRAKNAFESLINRRLGRARLERLLRAAHDAAAEPAPLPAPILELPQPPMPPTMDEILELVLPLLASSVAGLDAVALIESHSIEELAAVRDEFKTMLDSLRLWVEPLAWMWGRHGAFLQLLADMPRFISASDLPDFLLAALMVRRVLPPPVLALIANPSPPQILWEIAALKAVRYHVPGAETVVTPPAVRALLRNKEAAQRYLPKINEFMSEHEGEVRAVLGSLPPASAASEPKPDGAPGQ